MHLETIPSFHYLTQSWVCVCIAHKAVGYMSSDVKALPQVTVLYCCGKNNCPCLPEISRLQDYSNRMRYGTELDIHLGGIMNAFEVLQTGDYEWNLLYLFHPKNLLDYIEYDHNADNSYKHLWNNKMVVVEEVSAVPLVFLDDGVKRQNCVGGTVK